MKRKIEKPKRKFLIRCQGRFNKGKYIECEFYILGNYGDRELEKHQAYEMELDDRKTIFWSGFETDFERG